MELAFDRPATTMLSSLFLAYASAKVQSQVTRNRTRLL
jgi:hypothetical protein